MMIKTRFAPSPTGFLHLGGARTALFAYAYAKKNNGKFILRIEDTDLERSTLDSVTSIIEAMNWLGLSYDEGPYYQTQRINRYKEMIEQLIKNDLAYYCYCSKEELEQMREEQKQQGLKPKYDRRCLHHRIIKPEITPVIRFKNPDTGSVVWQDLVKGKIEINNSELDDLIIARSDGSPTYNFCVVVDDLDMEITHVIRGDDHINNTPRQINIFKAFNVPIPLYAHVPMILREDGQKMSKRHDAVSVIDYKTMGILPEALLNYLARLCWAHGNDEIFDLNQFIEWFDLKNISLSGARFDIKKLLWVNSQHIKKTDNTVLAKLVVEELNFKGITIPFEQKLLDIIELVKPRHDNLIAIATECSYFYYPSTIKDADMQTFLTDEALQILNKFASELKKLQTWDLDNIKAIIKEFCSKNNLKMPQLGMPLRLKLCGTTQTPSFDAIIKILGRDTVLERINS